jgi:hypothetical protein
MNISYISGFFDADGYVTLIKIASCETAKAPVLGFTNTNLTVLLLIKDFFKREYQLNGSIKIKRPVKRNHAVGYDLRYERNAAIKIGNLMLNDLTHSKKLHRLSLICSCYKLVVPRNGKYNDNMLQKLQEFEEEFYQEIDD